MKTTFLFLFLIFAVETANAQLTLTVTRSDDRNTTCNSGVDCSLREAINDANALGTNDAINFANGLSTIILANEIQINNNGTLTINGPRANILTIDGGAGTNRIFSINNAAVTITGVTLTGGNGTGAFNNGYGGAIDVDFGSLTLVGVNVTGNTAAPRLGGGVHYVGGTNHSIRDSTFSSNSAGNCGALYNEGTALTITNSTISENTSIGAGSGAVCNAGNLTLRSVTITGNNAGRGGGIFNAGILNIGNTIVAGNTATNQPEIHNTVTTVTSVGNNLIGDHAGDSTDTWVAITYQPSDILDTPPILSALGPNGGPTPSRVPLIGSPAIDAGNNALIAEPFDQRGAGFLRIRDGNEDGTATVDIGAFEVQVAPSAAVSISGVISYNTALAGQPKAVAGVLMSTIGAAPAYSNASGFYQIDNLTNGGNYTVTPSKTGNVNGISPFDATMVLRHVAANGTGPNALTLNQQKAADTNGDGSITPFDATLILRYIAAGAPNANTGQVGNWTFDPVPRKYEPLSGNMFNQNYTAILVGEVSGDWAP